MIDMVVHRHDLRETLVRLIGLLRNPLPSADMVPVIPEIEDRRDTPPDEAATASEVSTPPLERAAE
jgi:acetyl-CoA carboxylase carboxyl transferase subunit beta